MGVTLIKPLFFIEEATSFYFEKIQLTNSYQDKCA